MLKKNPPHYRDGLSKDHLTHGVLEVHKTNSKKEEHLEELQRNGYTILRNVISKNDCNKAKKKIDEIYKKQIDELEAPDSAFWKKTHPNHERAVQEVYKLRQMLNG